MKKVSILMPMYNSEKYITESINSILNQGYENIELIIVDDGSTDLSIKIVEKYSDSRIKLYKNIENKGLPYTRNKLLNLATGEYIALLDSDDIALENRIKIQVEFLENNKNIDIVGSSAIIFGKYKVEKPSKVIIGVENIKCNLMFGNCMLNSTVMMRSSFIKENKLFYRKECEVCQDYSFFVDAALVGNIENMNISTIKYRTGHENITKKSKMKNINLRKNILKEIGIRAFKGNGFFLDEVEYELISKYIWEKNESIKYNYQEFNELINILNKIIKINDNKQNLNQNSLEKCIKGVLLKTIILLDINLKEKIKLIKSNNLSISKFINSIIREVIKDTIKK